MLFSLQREYAPSVPLDLLIFVTITDIFLHALRFDSKHSVLMRGFIEKFSALVNTFRQVTTKLSKTLHETTSARN